MEDTLLTDVGLYYYAFTMTEPTPRNLPHTSPDAAAEARDQAEAYESMFATTDLELDDGTILKIPPHPSYNMLDDDRMAEYEQLMFEVDTEYEREEDIYIPEQKLDNGITLPSSTQRGALKMPLRRLDENGKPVLVTPPHNVRLVQVALGEKNYELLRAGGKSSADVMRIWTDQSLKIRERQQRDSKSDAGTVDLAPVSKADS